MKHKIIKTDNYLLVVDDSEIKINDWTYHPIKGLYKAVVDGAYTNQKKVIAHLPLKDTLIFEGVPLLPPLEDEDNFHPIDEYDKEYLSSLTFDGKSFVSDVLLATRLGYNKAREKYKFTEEDVIKIVEKSRETGLTAEYLMLSLSQPKMPTHFEVDMREYGFFDCDSIVVEGEEPKTTTNSQRQTQIVGRYIYE